MRFRHASTRHAFSLIELLVVVAVIAALTALLLPVIRMVRDRAHVAACSSQLRSLAAATIAYATDNDDLVPQGGNYNDASNGNWFNCPQVVAVMTYLEVTASNATATTSALRCPANRTGLMYLFWPGVPVDQPLSFTRLIAMGQRNRIPGARPTLWADPCYLSNGGTGRGFNNGCSHKGQWLGPTSGIPRGGNVSFTDGAVAWAAYRPGNVTYLGTDLQVVVGYVTQAIPTTSIWFPMTSTGYLQSDTVYIGRITFTSSTSF